jgi:hypothetical protein
VPFITVAGPVVVQNGHIRKKLLSSDEGGGPEGEDPVGRTNRSHAVSITERAKAAASRAACVVMTIPLTGGGE